MLLVLTTVRLILIPVKATEWPPFGQELYSRLANRLFVILVNYHLGFDGGIEPVPGHCLPFACFSTLPTGWWAQPLRGQNRRFIQQYLGDDLQWEFWFRRGPYHLWIFRLQVSSNNIP